MNSIILEQQHGDTFGVLTGGLYIKLCNHFQSQISNKTIQF